MVRKKVAKKAAKKVAKKSVKKAAKKVAKKVARKSTRAYTTRPQVTLEDRIVDILGKSSTPLRTSEIIAGLRKAKAPTRSANFPVVVSATLGRSKRIKKVRKGVYKLK